jgi:dTDP-4-amino-4,6-dideoxygalactose transaminase
MNKLSFFRRLAIWPTLPPAVHFRKSTENLPFPLDQANCRVFSLARHAIWSTLKAINLKPDAVVLVPAYHHGSEIEALLQAGLKIRYYEVDEKLEPDQNMLETLVNPDVRAFYLIHYLGFPQNAARWRAWCDEKGLLLIEDAAQAFLATVEGKPVGSFGQIGIFCLYKTYGVPDGGAVVSEWPVQLPATGAPSGSWRMLKRHLNWIAARFAAVGFVHLILSPLFYWLKKQNHARAHEFMLGVPSTPTAAMTTRLLPKIVDEETPFQRRENYRFLLRYLGQLVPAPFQTLPDGACPFAFPVEIEDARLFIRLLRKYGVIGLLFWANPHPSLPVEDFPRSRALRERIMALPVHQELTKAQLQQIMIAVKKVYSKMHTAPLPTDFSAFPASTG